MNDSNKNATAPENTAVDGTLGAKTPQKVYVISHSGHKGLYKIGISTVPERRLKSFHTADPNRSHKLEWQSKETTHAAEVEERLHTLYQYRNEWCQGDLEDIKRAAEELIDSAEKGEIVSPAEYRLSKIVRERMEELRFEFDAIRERGGGKMNIKTLPEAVSIVAQMKVLRDIWRQFTSSKTMSKDKVYAFLNSKIVDTRKKLRDIKAI